MSHAPFVQVILLNWRTPEMTLRALDATRKAMKGVHGLITVVDNDSGDGSFEALKGATMEMKRVRVLQSGRNGGFGAGNNYGILSGLPGGQRPDFLYIQNSDTFPRPGAITALLAHLQSHPRAGLAGSILHGASGETHLSTFRFPSWISEFESAARMGPVSRLLRRRRVPLETPPSAQKVDWLAGASLMIRAEVLSRIGLFDERFFLYFEETDLCRRAALAGYETHFVPASVVTHLGSVSTGMKEWTAVPGYWYESRLHYFVKNHGRAYALLATTAHLMGGWLHRLRCRLGGTAPVDPPGFLRALLRHDLAAMFNAERGQ